MPNKITLQATVKVHKIQQPVNILVEIQSVENYLKLQERYF